jgi:hypothetical protein
VPGISARLNIWSSATHFHKAPTSNFMESRQMGSTLIQGATRTDGHDEGNRRFFFATVRTRLKTRVQGRHKPRRPSPHNIRIVKLYETFHTLWLFRQCVCILWLPVCKRARVCSKSACFTLCSVQIRNQPRRHKGRNKSHFSYHSILQL